MKVWLPSVSANMQGTTSIALLAPGRGAASVADVLAARNPTGSFASTRESPTNSTKRSRTPQSGSEMHTRPGSCFDATAHWHRIAPRRSTLAICSHWLQAGCCQPNHQTKTRSKSGSMAKMPTQPATIQKIELPCLRDAIDGAPEADDGTVSQNTGSRRPSDRATLTCHRQHPARDRFEKYTGVIPFRLHECLLRAALCVSLFGILFVALVAM